MSHENLDRKYRPQTFETVRGQERCVRYLSNLVLRKARPRNILLHGAIGSGKTSLARIYARAINCEFPSEHGSPCQQCTPCLSQDAEHWQEYDVAGKDADPEAIQAWLQNWNRPMHPQQYLTLFLDEAHALPRKSADVLLKAVEEPADGVVFVFATTEIENIRPALQSRLAQLEVLPLAPADALKFLKDHADAECMNYDVQALSLLAGWKNGYPRDLLIGLEQVHHGADERITVSKIIEEFDLDHTNMLVRYFCSLSIRVPAEQMDAFQSWREPTDSKLKWLQGMLLSLYYNHVLGAKIVLDPLLSAIEDVALADILRLFRARFNVTCNQDLHMPFRAMIEFWVRPMPIASETATYLHLSAFHDLINNWPDKGTAPESKPRGSGAGKLQGAGGNTASFPARMVIASTELEADRYLNAGDVREIVACASFLTQHRGVMFNARLELRPQMISDVGDSGAYDCILHFCDELLSRPGDHYCVAQVERDSLGLIARMLAYIDVKGAGASADPAGKSPECWSEVEAMLRRGPGSARSDIGSLTFERLGTSPDPLRENWQNVLDLCSGLDERVPDEGCGTSLLDLLGIKEKHRRQSSPVYGPCLLVSSNLSDSARRFAAANKMEFLSAFDDCAWTSLRTGWEASEFEDRKSEAARRAEALAELERAFSDDLSRLEGKKQELLNAWPDDPHDRPRSWDIWWRPRPV